MADPQSSPDNPATPKPDVRRTVHEDMGVRVERDMTNSSDWLARGSKTHFSKIKFHSVGRSFAEPSASPPPAAPAADPEPPVVSRSGAAEPSVSAAAAAPGGSPPELPPTPGFLDRIKSLFGL